MRESWNGEVCKTASLEPAAEGNPCLLVGLSTIHDAGDAGSRAAVNKASPSVVRAFWVVSRTCEAHGVAYQ